MRGRRLLTEKGNKIQDASDAKEDAAKVAI